MNTEDHVEIISEAIAIYPYNYKPAKVVRYSNGTIRWFQSNECGVDIELPPFIGYPEDLQERIDKWYDDE